MISVNNQSAQVAAIQFQSNQAMRVTSIERLSSGLRVNSASDGASDLALATRLNSLIKSSDVAKRNINDGLGLLEVTEGALSEITKNLSRMLELSIASSNGTLGDGDRVNLDLEYQASGKNILDITQNTSFNSINTLTQSGQGIALQVSGESGSTRWELDLLAQYSLDGVTFSGSLQSIFNQIEVFQNNLAAQSKSEAVFSDIRTQESSQRSIELIQAAQDTSTTLRASVGSQQNILQGIYSNLETLQRNTQSAMSRVVDADFAVEVSNLINTNIADIGAQIGFAQGLQSSRQAIAVLEGSSIDFESFSRASDDNVEDPLNPSQPNPLDNSDQISPRLSSESPISEALAQPLEQNTSSPMLEAPEIGASAGFNFLSTDTNNRG